MANLPWAEMKRFIGAKRGVNSDHWPESIAIEYVTRVKTMCQFDDKAKANGIMTNVSDGKSIARNGEHAGRIDVNLQQFPGLASSLYSQGADNVLRI